MGHHVNKHGAVLQCSRCRKRRKLGAYKFWTSTPCAGAKRRREETRTDSEAPAGRARVDSPMVRELLHAAADDDEDPFGHLQLGIDDIGGGEDSSPFAEKSAEQALDDPEAPAVTSDLPSREHLSAGKRPQPTELSQGACRLEALRRRVQAREHTASALGIGFKQLTPQVVQDQSSRRRRANVGPPIQTGHAASDIVGFVTPAKRRRLLAAQRAQSREDGAMAREAKGAAWHHFARNLPQVEESDFLAVVPFSVHTSHDCIICGGFIGCIRCGSGFSARAQSGTCTHGTARAVKRLAVGRLPRGRAWPSGESEPLPKCWHQ